MRRVLIIDDNPMQLRARELVLRGAGFPVSTAAAVDDALALLRSSDDQQEIGLVITDHVMPGGSGADFVRELRRDNPALPVIVITGLAEAEDEYSSLGVTFLQKPCPPPELVRLVRNYLSEDPPQTAPSLG
jgi:DNA-binding response OmpR family regulator